MANDIAIVENFLRPLEPHFKEVLAGRMPVERLTRTVIISIERQPKLLECTPQSIMNSAMTAAVLCLEVDGVTGQAFLIPYGKTAQLVIGYKGMNTLAARSGFTITAAVVREGDEFDFSLGTDAFVKHKPLRGNTGRITEAWAVADAIGMKPIVTVLSIDDILKVKKKSPGAKKSDSPWNDPDIGFVAMAEKTARRRLSRSMPLNAKTRDYILASRMEEAFEEQGLPAHIAPGGELVIEGKIADTEQNPTPTMEQLLDKPEADAIDATVQVLQRDGIVAAEEGMKSLRIWFGDLPQAGQRAVKPFLDSKLKPYADRRDREIKEEFEREFLPMKLAEIAEVEGVELTDLVKATTDALAHFPDLMDRFLEAAVARQDELRAAAKPTEQQAENRQLSETDF